MSDETSDNPIPVSEPDGSFDQFRLVRMQTYNWGTFTGISDFPISEIGFLFVGPSGSGKSTILDAHAALLTPPKWVDFNVAAREQERHGKDRNVMTYVRGAWAQQTGESGEYVAQYLRSGTTWSAIAETYCNRHGKYVVLAQLLWIRGKSTAVTDVKKSYLIFERDFDIREFEFFPKCEFEVRKIRPSLPDAFVRDEFSAYQERFRRLLGIDNELALRLLHKTQSAKNLGDLNTFLRDFMLDVPQTFEIADRLVGEFGELNAAHQAVVAARRQIETLVPARTEFSELKETKNALSEVNVVLEGIDPYREQHRKILLISRLSQFEIELEGGKQEVRRLSAIVDQEFAKLGELQDRFHGMGGGVIEQLRKQLDDAEREKEDRLLKRRRAADACMGMGWSLPNDPQTFVQLTESARQRILKAHELSDTLERLKDQIKDQQREKTEAFRSVRTEIEAMERQPSNIPSRMLDLRQFVAGAVGIAPEKLPFVGELLEVREEERKWQGAIERVLHGFALSILVDDKYYSPVSAYLNDKHIGERLVYFRVLTQPMMPKSLSANSLIRKLNVAPGNYAEWLWGELRTRFDYDCAETVNALRNSQRAITAQGQVKHGPTRHEKDDRFRVDDRARWVLGFDNKNKLELYKEQAFALGKELAILAKKLDDARREEGRQRDQMLCSQTLANLTWSDIDVASVLSKITSLNDRVRAEQASRPDLAGINVEISKQNTLYETALKAKNDAAGTVSTKNKEIENVNKRLGSLSAVLLSYPLTPLQKTRLEERCARVEKPVTLDFLDQIVGLVERSLSEDKNRLGIQAETLKNSIERRFADFVRNWPVEGGGLDAKLESGEDFFAKLSRLETDGLPRFEERFLNLLREQSDQNLTLLSARLDQERKGILDRLELVNESLLSAEFNPGTHLVIEPLERTLEDVKAFKGTLREALSHSFSDETSVAEHRFEILSTLVKRIASQENSDRNWRALVLDVRQHVEFVARELNSDDAEVEIYRSGAGKSGGQRQKLAATCLAAALRYQLGGQDRALPRFSTVVLDEAFDKADAEFTAMAMNIFRTFGFQMIVATPLKSVMTLEPFIGGACFVHIRDRKNSASVMIEYDIQQQRLRLPVHSHEHEETAIP